MKRLTALAAAVLLAVAVPAAALPNFGARAGFTSGPDQIHLGAHAEVLELRPGLVFLPNLEVGLGDNQTVWALNAEVAWTIDRADWRDWRPYVGGGLGLFIISYDQPDAPPGFDDRRSNAGLSVLFGAAKMLRLGHKAFVEVKLGLEDAPDVKFTTGLTFF
ncbi:MAG: hypothetical protein ACYDIE_12455 [Candidatus Krumholzibacteriia bacterium]